MLSHIVSEFHLHTADLAVVVILAAALYWGPPRRRKVPAERRAAIREYLHILRPKK